MSAPARRAAEPRDAAPDGTPLPGRSPLLPLFFLSGLTGLVYELVFSKLLGTIFGITAHAAATVLAAFMGGLALGSAVASRAVDRNRRPLRTYAWIELAVAACMLAVPALLDLIRGGYLALGRSAPTPAALTLVRFGLGSALIVVPAALMGATLPLLARHFAGRGEGSGATVARLYAVNTFGAAAGCVVANYLLLPWTGIYGAIGAGVLLNGYVGWRAWRLDRAEGGPAAARVVAELPPEPQPGDRLLLLAAALTGLLAFAYEVSWMHLLGVVVGTSAYAFGDMLLALLLGIAAGSLWIARHPASPEQQRRRLVRCQLGIGMAVALTLPLWDRLPLLFRVAGYALPGFYLREAVRLAASLLPLAVPTLLMGVSFPLLIEGLGGGPARLGRRVGAAYALNTLGAIAGSTLTGFWLLPVLGSRRALLVTAAASVALGLLLAVRLARGAAAERRWALAATAVIGLAFLVFPDWNYRVLLSGYNVYFGGAPPVERILYVHDDVAGGITSVARLRSGELELRTNGKFEGSDRRQMEAQWGFALIPVLVSRGRERAAVIGLGTGVTAGTLARFPYRRIDVAEIAPGIATAARRWFADVNGRVLDDPRVRLHLEDGRNMLLLADTVRYDLVTVEVTSIWFAGAANVYSRDFFQLVKDRLAPGGVFQQWVQFHHLDPLDLLRILNTLRQVFPHVTLWRSGGQGMLVASADPIRADYATALALTAPAAVQPALDSLPLRHPLALFGDLLLDEAQVDSAIGFIGSRLGPRLTRLFVSTDRYPWLEYSTPRANADALQYGATLKFFENYDAHRAPPIDGIPAGQQNLVFGLAALRKGNLGNALRLLERAAAAEPARPGLAELVERVRQRVESNPL